MSNSVINRFNASLSCFVAVGCSIFLAIMMALPVSMIVIGKIFLLPFSIELYSAPMEPALSVRAAHQCYAFHISVFFLIVLFSL